MTTSSRYLTPLLTTDAPYSRALHLHRLSFFANGGTPRSLCFVTHSLVLLASVLCSLTSIDSLPFNDTTSFTAVVLPHSLTDFSCATLASTFSAVRTFTPHSICDSYLFLIIAAQFLQPSLYAYPLRFLYTLSSAHLSYLITHALYCTLPGLTLLSLLSLPGLPQLFHRHLYF